SFFGTHILHRAVDQTPQQILIIAFGVGTVRLMPGQLLSGGWMVVAIRTLVALGPVMNKHLASEARQMLHLDPITIPVKHHDLSPTLVTIRMIEGTFDFDMD